ncbi:hypothetical protein M2194_003424 [Bradyrhizobium elkanii]|nr:hypothetical protein [Bradyrhizobium elkanii]
MGVGVAFIGPLVMRKSGQFVPSGSEIIFLNHDSQPWREGLPPSCRARQ